MIEILETRVTVPATNAGGQTQTTILDFDRDDEGVVVNNDNNADLSIASDTIQHHLNRLCLHQQYETRLLISDYNDSRKSITLHETPVDLSQTLTIEHKQPDGTYVTIDSNHFAVGVESITPLKGWPCGEIRLRYTAGYDPIPSVIKSAVKTYSKWIAEEPAIDDRYTTPQPFEQAKVAHSTSGSLLLNDAGMLAFRERAAFNRENPRQFLMPSWMLRTIDPYVKRRLV